MHKGLIVVTASLCIDIISYAPTLSSLTESGHFCFQEVGAIAYKVIISYNNNEEVMVLPHVPPDFPLPEPEQHNETYTGLSKDYRRIGTLGLRQYSWDSFFPVGHRYAFMPPEASDNGWDYVAFFQRGRERKVPFRMIVLDSSGVCRLNTPITVDSLDTSVRRNGDIAYSISCTEYRFVV